MPGGRSPGVNPPDLMPCVMYASHSHRCHASSPSERPSLSGRKSYWFTGSALSTAAVRVDSISQSSKNRWISVLGTASSCVCVSVSTAVDRTILRRHALLTERQPHDRGAAGATFRGGVGAAVLERQRAAVRLGDLARECEADAGTRGLRGKERDEQVRRVGETRALVEHAQLERVVGHRPLDPDAALRLERGI